MDFIVDKPFEREVIEKNISDWFVEDVKEVESICKEGLDGLLKNSLRTSSDRVYEGGRE